MDPIEYLETEDPLKAAVMARVTTRSFERRDELDRKLATQIANAVVKAIGGK